MVKFRDLFSFSQAEIASIFPRITLTKRVPGLRLMQAPLQVNSRTTRDSLSSSCNSELCSKTPNLSKDQKDNSGSSPSHGKLLIVISRKTGKAHLRNLFRRRIKSIFYEKKFYEKKVYSVLNVYPEATTLSFEQLEEQLVSWFKNFKVNS